MCDSLIAHLHSGHSGFFTSHSEKHESRGLQVRMEKKNSFWLRSRAYRQCTANKTRGRKECMLPAIAWDIGMCSTLWMKMTGDDAWQPADNRVVCTCFREHKHKGQVGAYPASPSASSAPASAAASASAAANGTPWINWRHFLTSNKSIKES
jgi:hypothetical protein